MTSRTNGSKARQCLVFLALVCLVWTVTGLQAQAKVTITFSQWGEERWADIVERFNAEHDDIELEYMQISPHATYYDKVLTMVAGGAGPDLIVSNPQNAPVFVNDGIWMNLDPFIERDGFNFDDYLEGGWAYTRFNDHYYAWPSGVAAPFPTRLYAYNMDMFAARGTMTPTPGWTFQDYVELTKRLTVDANGDGEPEVYGSKAPVPKWYMDWVWSNGGDLVSNDCSEFRLTEPQSLEALQLIIDLFGNKWGSTKVSGSMPTVFANGSVAMANTHLSSALRMSEDGLDFEWGIVPTPAGKAGAVSRAGTIPIGINKFTKHPEEAWTFLKWLTSPEIQAWAVSEDIIYPVHRSAVRSPEYLSRPIPPYDITALVMQTPGYDPMCECFTDVDAVVVKTLKDTAKTLGSAKVAMDSIKGQVQGIIDSYK